MSSMENKINNKKNDFVSDNKKNLLLPTLAEHETGQERSIIYHKHEIEDKQKYGKIAIARARERLKQEIERVKQEIQNERKQLQDRNAKLKDKNSYSDYIKELRERHNNEYNILENEDSKKI